jgi:diaminopimelate decarboxylase
MNRFMSAADASRELLNASWNRDAANPDQAWVLDAAGELLIGGRPLTRAVTAAGGTPCYLYDRARLSARVRALREVLPAAVDLHYAIKCNPMPALVGHMAAVCDGLDVASAGELRVALDAGMAPENISFAGPGKRDAELVQAQAAGVLVNVESVRELRVLADASAASGEAARVALRVNPPFELKASGMRMGGGARPFGVDAEQVPALLREISTLGLSFEGFHLYAGSQNLKAAAIIEAQSESYALLRSFADQVPAPVRSLNLGGGFGIPYTSADVPLEPGPIGDHLGLLVERCGDDFPQARLVLELGRYLAGTAGLYVCRVLDRKVSRGQVFYVCDGGMHQHLAASGNFGQVIRRNYPVLVNGRPEGSEIASVVGPLCTPLDLLADRAELAPAEIGDLVVVFQSGAYGRSASPRAFLGHPEPNEALV